MGGATTSDSDCRQRQRLSTPTATASGNENVSPRGTSDVTLRSPMLYHYVGPKRILEQARDQPPGFEVRSLADLRIWLSHHGARGRELTVTFVIDAAGVLRVADRHSEHVACAAGGPVRSAGEMAFALVGERVRVTSVSNQSTGFCPEPSSCPRPGRRASFPWKDRSREARSHAQRRCPTGARGEAFRSATGRGAPLRCPREPRRG